jgi:hypothetical protein
MAFTPSRLGFARWTSHNDVKPGMEVMTTPFDLDKFVAKGRREEFEAPPGSPASAIIAGTLRSASGNSCAWMAAP